jgi:hypothetical protein
MHRILISAVLFFLLASGAEACTVFAAAGGEDIVKGGGTLAAKVRDETSFRHTVKTVRPETGYAYYGLFNGRNLNMGVNEKGLVVFRTTAGSVPEDVRRSAARFKSPEGLRGPEFIARTCASVDEALQQKEIFRMEPVNYMIADRRKIAFVEVFPNGTYAAEVKERGTLTHTNHYITEDGTPFNAKIGKSTSNRLKRINALLSETPKPYTLENFRSFTEDRTDDIRNSIFRAGIPSKGHVRTLATMAVYLPPAGAPEVILKWRDSPENPAVWHEERVRPDFGK